MSVSSQSVGDCSAKTEVKSYITTFLTYAEYNLGAVSYIINYNDTDPVKIVVGNLASYDDGFGNNANAVYAAP